MKRNLALAIVHLMHVAKVHIMYPKIRLNANDLPIQLSVAGDKAKFPTSINITDGKPYGESKFYGRIMPDGTTNWNGNCKAIKIMDVEEQLELFADDPAGYAKLYSEGTGNCMFCMKELSDPQSVAVGYGPICAAHYGLPHGDVKDAETTTEVEHDLAEFNLEMVHHASIIPAKVKALANMQIDLGVRPTLEDQVAALQLQVEALEIQFTGLGNTVLKLLENKDAI